MKKAKQQQIASFLKEALQRALLEVQHLASTEHDEDFIGLMHSIREDFEMLADRCNVMLQDYMTPEEEAK